jgi:serine/threonine-protein kinase
MWEQPLMLNPGDLLDNRYRLIDRIATGGMGDVWRATDLELDRTVAVKAVYARQLDDKGIGERFRVEARAMAALRHQGVAAVYDYSETSLPQGPDIAYIVMACVGGQPLSDRIAQAGRLDPDETMSLVAQAARALQAVHDGGVVHRDVKPANLIVEPDGHVVLIDFGVALVLAAAGMTDADVVVGTALYMAPEQISKDEITPATDIYALGAVAYHCLAGRPPFLGDDALAVAMRHVDDEVPPLPDDIPAAARDLVLTSLTKDPARRFASAAALADAAEAVAATLRSQPTQALASLDTQVLRSAAPVGLAGGRTVMRPRTVMAAVVAAVTGLVAALMFTTPAGPLPAPFDHPSGSAPAAIPPDGPGGPGAPTGGGAGTADSAAAATPAGGVGTVPVAGPRDTRTAGRSGGEGSPGAAPTSDADGGPTRSTAPTPTVSDEPTGQRSATRQSDIVTPTAST